MVRKSMDQRWNEDDRIFLGVNIKKRLIPTIIGGVIGDALGVPVEFKERNQNIKGMTGYGTYNQPEGTWSDDTSLTLCLIQNIIDEKDEKDLMEKFVAYRDNGYWTPYGEMFDIGRTTDEAINRYKAGLSVDKCGGNSDYDNGNGALMRIAPLVFTLTDQFDFKERLKRVESIVQLTHRHPRSTLGCVFYIELLNRLFHNNSKLDAYNKAINICKDNLGGTVYEREFSYWERLFSGRIHDVKKEDIVSDGYVVHSLEAAIWCFLKHNNYSDAVLEAVNLGGDTDTIALITGTMAGMFYKLDDIPEQWIDKLARKEDLMDICNQYFEYCFKLADSKKNVWKP